jgi:hypothetical protein
MSSRRSTATTQRPKPQAELLPDEVGAFLDEGGWVRGGDPSRVATTADLWAHATKAGGNPLPAEQAYEFETRAREAIAAQGDGAETDEEHAARFQAEAVAEIADAREREAAAEAQAAAKAESDRAEQSAALRRRIDLAERAAAEAAEAPDPEFAHDQIGPVSLWRCYACNFECRYSPVCHCETCEHLHKQESCPRCDDKQPNIDPRHR